MGAEAAIGLHPGIPYVPVRMRSYPLSRTAAFIAIKFYGITLWEPFRSLFDPKLILFYDRTVRAFPEPLNRFHPLLKHRWARNLFTLLEERLLPGDLLHIIMRKYFIGRQVAELLAGDYKQLVVLGAGFDHLAVYHSNRGTPSFEIDKPTVQRLKKKFVSTYGYRNSSLCIRQADFARTPAKQVLRNIPGLDPGKNTIVVAEGFFDYLEQAQTSRLLGQISDWFQGKLTVISTVFALDELSRRHRWVFTTSVALAGEQIRLGLSRKELKSVFGKNGFNPISCLSAHQMRERLAPREERNLHTMKGFYVMRCRKTEKK